MIFEYLENERCVVLITVPALEDYHNNPLIGKAKEIDPETKRVFPVVTKTDQI